MPHGPSDESMTRFHESLDGDSLAPLWERMRELAPREPRSAAVAKHWSAERLKEHALTAGRLITAEQAERRVVVLENPGLKGRSQITTSLYAGIQTILPGEVARTHRHSASALRFILQGQGGYTIVDGERVSMHPGDFVITPTWSLHDHGNEGSEPVIWLDGLDVPIINLLTTGFAEDGADDQQRVRMRGGDSVARYASGLLPVSYTPRGVTSPLFWYPWTRTRDALEQMRLTGEWDDAEGLRLAFTDPTTGRSPIATMGAFIQLLPAGFRGTSLRSTDGTVYCAFEGHGEVRVGEHTWPIAPHDIFVVPSWVWHDVSAVDDLVLFSFSDRPLQKHLGLWREQRAIPSASGHSHH